MGIVTSIRKYKNTLSKNVTILEGKKHFWDIKLKSKLVFIHLLNSI